MSLVNHTPAWRALETHWQEMRQVHLRDLFDGRSGSGQPR